MVRCFHVKFLITILLVSIFCVLPCPGQYQTITATRKYIDLNGPWQVFYDEAKTFGSIEEKKLNTIEWTTTNLPEFRVVPGKNSAIYQKHITLDKIPDNTRAILKISAAMLACNVYVNNKEVGCHGGGFTPFEFDVTEQLKPGDNDILIYLIGETFAISAKKQAAQHQLGGTLATMAGQIPDKKIQAAVRNSSRLGIWQDIRLELLPKERIENLHVIAEPLENRIDLVINHNLCPDTDLLRIESDIYDKNSNRVYAYSEKIESTNARPLTLKLCNPTLKFWSPDHPALYHLKVRLYKNARLMDEFVKRFGYRKFEIKGGYFYLNGVKTILRGESELFPVSMLRCAFGTEKVVGDYYNKETLKRYLTVMKEKLDLNYFRVCAELGHELVFDLADELGLLIECQSSVWSTMYNYYLNGGDQFLHNTQQEFKEWILRDRNHPSIIYWSSENEMLRIARKDSKEEAFFLQLDDFIRKYDTTRPISHDGAAANSRAISFYHVHNEENYDKLMKHWDKKKPLVFGEFWIGGRAAERRLISGAEFFSYDDYVNKQDYLWTQKIEQMRIYDASGICPYRVYPTLFRNLGRKTSPHDSIAIKLFDSILQYVNLAGPGQGYDLDPGVLKTFRHLLGRYFVTFMQKSSYYYADTNGIVKIPVYIKNDSPQKRNLLLDIRIDGTIFKTLKCSMPAGERCVEYFEYKLASDYEKKSINLELKDKNGTLLDEKQAELFFHKKSSLPLQLKSRVYLLQNKWTKTYADYLKAKQVNLLQISRNELGSVPANSVLIASLDDFVSEPMLESKLQEKKINCFITEGALDDQQGLCGVKVYNLKIIMLNEGHFIDIFKRNVYVDDFYYTSQSVCESDIHPVLKEVQVRNITGFSADETMVSKGVIVGPNMKLKNIKADLQDIGVEIAGQKQIVPGAGDSPKLPTTSNYLFRSLMTGSRRQYSVLGELTDKNHRLIISRLYLSQSLGKNPLADIIFNSALRYLENAGRCPRALLPENQNNLAKYCTLIDGKTGAVNTEKYPVIIFCNLDNLSPEVKKKYHNLLSGMEISPLTQQANYLAFLQRGYFSSSKYFPIETAGFNHVLQPLPDTKVNGGLQLMDVGQKSWGSLFFPWVQNAGFPQSLGFSALQHDIKDNKVLYFVEDIFDDKGNVRKKYQNIIANVFDSRLLVTK